MDLRLPEHYLITPEPETGRESLDFLPRLSAALQQGIKLVQLRAKTIDESAFTKLAGDASDICRQAGSRLIVNGEPSLLSEVDADGVHLSSARLMACTQRPLGHGKLISAACHNLAELLHAQRLGVDFVTLSPVLATTSHPGATALGWKRFGELAAAVQIPIYALGGMTRDQLELAKAHGAHGIAAITGLW